MAARAAVDAAGAAQGFHARSLAGLRKPGDGGGLHPADPGGADRRAGARAGGAGARRWTWMCWSRCMTARELDRALGLQTKLIGINNRNLKTLKTDLATTERARRRRCRRTASWSPKAASRTHADLRGWPALGVGGFLVGESLMRQADVAAATRALLGTADVSGGFTHFDAAGNAAMVDVGGKPVTDARRHRAGAGGDAAGDAGDDPRGQREEGRRAGRGAAGRHHGGQAHRRPDPALPSAAADRGDGRSGAATARTRWRSRRRCGPPGAPAWRWRR